MTPSQRRLVEENLGLARHAANLYLSRYPRLRDMADDLHQEAVLGLMHAAQKYEPAKGKFSTYGWWWASARIREYARLAINPVSGVPGTQAGGKSAVFVPRSEFHAESMGGAMNTDEELLDAAGVAREVRSHLEFLCGGKNAVRDVEVFLRIKFDPTERVMELPPSRRNVPRNQRVTGDSSRLAKEYGISKQRVQQIVVAVQKKFDVLARDYQQEAA